MGGGPGRAADEQAHEDGIDLSGVNPRLVKQLRASHRIDPDLVTIVPATDTLLDSTRQASDQARTWLADQPHNEHEPVPGDNAA
jgi:hypothetical protein